MATPKEHRAIALELLAKATSYAPSAAPRLAYLAEAQVHAILALSPADDFGTPPVPEIDAQLAASVAEEKPAPARRTRKAPAAKEAAK